MKPTLVLISVLTALSLVSIIGYALGQLGKGPDCECPDQVAESDQEMKAGLSDLASAFSKINGDIAPQEAYQLVQEFQSCWPMMIEGQDIEFTDSEETAVLTVGFGMLLSTWVMARGSIDEAIEKCASLN